MLNIITPCSRPENLLTIAKTIPSEARWIICYDDRVKMPAIDGAIMMKCEDTGNVGALALNHILDNFAFNDNDWILVHDDDNIIHPELYNNIRPLLNSGYSMIYWGQIENNVIRIPLEKLAPAVECIDTACYMVKWKLNSQLRHQPIYTKDGIYAAQCAKNGPILKLNQYLCYYNFLRQNEILT